MPKESELQDLRFVGKVMVITGAGGQFGRAGCLFFARRGCKIAALDKSPTTLAETMQYLKEQQQNVTSLVGNNSPTSFDIQEYVCDVTDLEGQVSSVVDEIVKRFGRIDLLWNNAGYQGKIQPLLDLDPKDFRLVMDINVTGLFVVLQAVAKAMVAQQQQGSGSGNTCSIVNTASVAGMRGTPAMAAYASSKAAVFSLTVAAAKELAPHNIRVNAISPALIGPGYMWDRQNELHAECDSPYYANDPETVAQSKINSVPMKRLGSVEEVLKTVAFLLSDDSSYTTGSNLTVDGGMAAGVKA